jgi:hypothetical protein
MQILIAVIVMGLIATVAVVLAAGATISRLAPLLIAVLVVVGVVRSLQRRRKPRPAPPPLPGVIRPAPPQPVAPIRPTMPRPDGWMLVPMWWLPAQPVHRPPVLDADIISVEEHRG